MTLKIISAEKILFEGETRSVTLPGEMGLFTVLPRHASLVSTLTKGKISYTEAADGARREVEVEGGIADIDNDVVSVCVY
ncbi:MAG: F0F1 ATP synthase subunit epsilon [[Clostridium] fimetarium]|nr:F0F1 ATP synthase subunit epsilon [Alistipes timonensis]MCM1405084.1 F0F1 ATP synthase subunit epsilon [[Clostridium] fimetarium]